MYHPNIKNTKHEQICDNDRDREDVSQMTSYLPQLQQQDTHESFSLYIRHLYKVPNEPKWLWFFYALLNRCQCSATESACINGLFSLVEPLKAAAINSLTPTFTPSRFFSPTFNLRLIANMLPEGVGGREQGRAMSTIQVHFRILSIHGVE